MSYRSIPLKKCFIEVFHLVLVCISIVEPNEGQPFLCHTEKWYPIIIGQSKFANKNKQPMREQVGATYFCKRMVLPVSVLCNKTLTVRASLDVPNFIRHSRRPEQNHRLANSLIYWPVIRFWFSSLCNKI